MVGSLISETKRSIHRAVQYLKPTLDEKKALMEQNGDDWDDKPNDMLQWIFDEAIRRKNPDWGVAERVLLVNFAAIHTSSTVCALRAAVGLAADTFPELHAFHL